MLPPGGIIGNTRDCTFSDTVDMNGGQLRICWAAFSSEGFQIRTYSYQILQYSPNYGTQITPVTPVGLTTSTIVTGLQLEEHYTYFVKVYATNSAGITGEAQSQNFKIDLVGSGLGGLKTGVVVAICIVVVVIALAIITLIFFRWRYKKQKRAKKEHRGNMKLLKGTMFGLADYAGDPTQKHLDEIRNARELAFLITDLEGSTALSAADPKAFRHIQEIHDAVIREHIASHGGYEINTEGDAFYITCHSFIKLKPDVSYPFPVPRAGATTLMVCVS
ncbi:hypothetical protein WJX84_005955 [Apatococcus fuscideae]|uniref:Guanylate cyclase domain-containing protein n=1 Tax=Apatococcus fuscideae TaxID=2026836 RepID=A0AAW1T9W2_9CHLO